jgi:DnaJ-class molecular chaperone
MSTGIIWEEVPREITGNKEIIRHKARYYIEHDEVCTYCLGTGYIEGNSRLCYFCNGLGKTTRSIN